MKNIIRFSIATLAIITSSTALRAQNTALATGYFTDGYVGKHQLNPALTPNYGFFGFPLLNNLTVSTGSNLSMDKLLYPTSAGLSTFLSPNLDASTALSGFATMNPITATINESILATGFFNRKGTIFTSIDLGLRSDINTSIPKDVFALARGTEAVSGGKNYSLTDMDVKANVYTQLALAQSFAIGKAKKVHFGYRAKFLIGIADMNAHFNTFNAKLNKDQWVIESDATIRMNGVSFGTKQDEKKGKILNFSSPQLDKQILKNTFRNMGFSFDLGLVYDILPWLQISASAQDLGMIFYQNTQVATSKSYSSLGQEGDTAPTAKEFFEQLSDITKFTPSEEISSTKELLPMYVRAGIQIRIPQYQKFSIGALYTQKILKNYNGWELRASANYDLLRWMSLSVSYAYSKPLASVKGMQEHLFGALLNIHAKGFNIFVGADNIPLSYSAHGIPVKTATTTVSTGINFLFGQYNGRYPKVKKAE